LPLFVRERAWLLQNSSTTKRIAQTSYQSPLKLV
jgi:hypothetical protein